jgi:hypothetical protein
LFKEHYKRLKFSLNKSDYCDLVNKFHRLNESLYRITNQITTIEQLHSSNKSERRSIPKFNVINNRALDFHSVLSSGWKCPCHAYHSVSLRLESRMEDLCSDDQDVDDEESMRDPFRILFRYSHIYHPNKISSPATPAWIWDEADVHITLAKQSSSAMAMAIAPHGKGVRFSTTHVKKADQAALDLNSTLEIQDLCSAISTLQQPERDVCLSLLAPEHAKIEYGLLITPLKAPPLNPESWSVSSLRTALEDVKFTRRDRIGLAVTLASSVLQLHETPWLEDNWGKDNIFFIKRSEGKGYNDPFVSQYFNQANLFPSTQNPASKYRFIRNQTLFALGISLIELWYGKPLHKLHKQEDGEMTGDVQDDLVIKSNTAIRLVEYDLGDDAGDRYCDAVRRCIHCDFNKRGSSLVDAEFQMAVYHGFVSQLKETLDFMRVKS